MAAPYATPSPAPSRPPISSPAGRGSESPRAFTLIELLVVITIIVVLLALLTPALDKAIYQAELAVCGANQKAVVSGVSTYAIQNGRAYPARTNMEHTTWRQKEVLAEPNKGYDVRPLIDGYVPMDALVEPLGDRVLVGPDETEPDSIVFSGYALWFGWGFVGHARMSRIGARFTWTQPGTGVVHRFSALVSDFDDINEPPTGWPSAYTSHPDTAGVMQPRSVQDEVSGVYFGGVGTWGSGRYVLARYENNTRHDHGPMDRNVGFADGSVQRYSGARWDEYDTGRMVRVPPSEHATTSDISHDTLPPQ